MAPLFAGQANPVGPSCHARRPMPSRNSALIHQSDNANPIVLAIVSTEQVKRPDYQLANLAAKVSSNMGPGIDCTELRELPQPFKCSIDSFFNSFRAHLFHVIRERGGDAQRCHYATLSRFR